MRFVVHCDAVWPFQAWTQTSSWIYINGGFSPGFAHTSCGVTPWAEVQYG
jgi:hypothetical protein